jgi:cytochrome c peroxidase
VLLGACGGDAPTGPEEPDSLRERALAAGLAPIRASDIAYPSENPRVDARVDLGHLLFFDPILSGPRDVACSTCHLPDFSLADGRQFPAGAGATGLGPDRSDPSPPPLRLMPRNTPTVLNVGLFGRHSSDPTVNGMIFWSGTAFGLEDQTLLPIVMDNELRGLTYGKTVALDSVVHRLRSIPAYVQRFATAFPEFAGIPEPSAIITTTTLRRALAAYLRELVTGRAPIDAFLDGNDAALTDPQKRGLELFIGPAGCIACHHGPLLSDFQQYVLGARQMGIGRDTTPGNDLGWGETGGVPYAFRTPPLRQVALTSPYLHAGTAATLEDVVRFKNTARSDNPRVADTDLAPAFHPLGLDDADIRDIVAFLHALTDSVSILQPLFRAPPSVPSGLVIPGAAPPYQSSAGSASIR